MPSVALSPDGGCTPDIGSSVINLPIHALPPSPSLSLFPPPTSTWPWLVMIVPQHIVHL